MKDKKSSKCCCPFCEEELMMDCLEPAFCKHCKIKIIKCNKCNKLFNEKLKKCPECGNIIK